MTEQTVAYLRALSGLPSGTTMHYRVRTKNLDGTQFISADKTFTTLAATGYHAPAPTSQLTVNVRDKGAVGNGVNDDTASIQAAINQVSGTGGTVYVPDGTYLVSISSGAAALVLKSKITFRMSPGATLKMKPNASGTYFMLYGSGVTNINIVGGKLQGERHQHLTPGDDAHTTPYSSLCTGPQSCFGQWGMGIGLYGSSNIYIEDIELREMWGDGCYVSNVNNINFYSIVADDNRRQGISLIVANGVVIRDSVIKNTYGHEPECGIDFEPNDPGTAIRNVLLHNNVITGNKGSGVLIGVPNILGTNATISTTTLTGNTITGNGRVNTNRAGIYISGYGAYGCEVHNNTVTGNFGSAGIAIDINSGNVVTNNIVKDNTVTGGQIRQRFTTGNIISPNTTS
jgi:hypothetical protein